MKKLATLLLCLFAAAESAEIDVLKVHCDEPKTTYEFSVSLDEWDNISSLIKRSPDGQHTYSIQELQTKEVVVSKQRDKKVILLSCPNYKPETGGPFVVKFLYNGLTNAYKVLPLWIEKEQSGWQISTPPPERNKISALKVVPRKLAGMTIGIQHFQLVP